MMGGASKLLRLLSLSSPIPLLYTRTSTLRFFPHSWVSLNRISSPQNHNFFSNYRSFLGFSINSSQNIHTQISNITREDYHADPPGFSPNSRVSQSWPEWSNLMANLRYGGYFDRQSYSVHHDDAFSVFDDLPEEFVWAANACLLFARDRPDLLGSLSRRDIDVVVENGSPFLFKSAIDSARRMKSFLGSHGSNEMEFERGCTVDLMHFLLSYACNPIAASRGNNINNRELVESSVRNLLSELANVSRNVRGFDLSRSTPTHFSDSYGNTSRPTRQNIEMKKGDWICPKCNFMNFARNMKCLECDEARPKKQLTGGEWECPQCDFFNYGRNAVCLRCDCKRPGEALIGSSGPRSATGYSLNNPNNAEIESKLAENEEKAERWFSKISQQDNASDLSNGIADEDFPEIMPMRKGANRFVVSTRKTPLERRLANAQYRRNLGNDGIPEGNKSHAVGNESLDRILGHSSAVSEINNNVTASGNSLNESKVDSVYGKPTENLTQRPDDLRASSNGESLKGGSWQESRSYTVSSENNRESWKSLEGSAVKELDPLDMSEEAKAERWFRRVAQIKDISELSNIPDEDFPQIMPMRKGVNRFVVSKRKTPLERRLTSPQYRRNLPIVSSEPVKNENDSS